MKALYKMTLDCGRMGGRESVFVAEKELVDYLTSHQIEVYFGEVLGKNSEVSECIEPDKIMFITDDEKIIEIIEECDLQSGYNPLDRWLGADTDDIPDDGYDWEYNVTVREFIDYKLHGTLPNFD